MMRLWMVESLQCGRLQIPECGGKLLLKSDLRPFHVLYICIATDYR